MTNGFSLGRWLGINVKIHWSALLIALVLGVNLADQLGFAAAIAVVAFLLSIIVHEFGHALVARRFGVGTESIQLWALGGVARLDREAPSPKAEGWIAAAGPIASVAVALLSAGGFIAFRSTLSTPLVGILGWLAIVNLILALFNLLPGAPLDGGRIVTAIRWAMHGNKYRAQREASKAGQVVGAALGALGVFLLVQGNSGIWLIITALFIWNAARLESAHADFAEGLAGITVGDLTWYGIATAAEDTDADELLWGRARLGRAGGVSVTDATGLPKGIALEHELWQIPADERPWVMLSQLMVPFDHTTRAAPTDELSSILRRLNPARPIVTVWEGDRLVGMVPPKRLHEQLGWV